MKKHVDLTVALPVFNSSKILWLCLEGLCRQQTNCAWELLIMEDPSMNYAGRDYLNPYVDRLKEAGCVGASYLNVDKWIPLGEKWIKLAQRACGENFMLTAADNFSPPERIELSCEALVDHLWFDGRCSLFYNIQTNKIAQYTSCVPHTGVWMCTKTHLVKNLKGPGPPRSIDGWMRDNMNISSQDRCTVQKKLLNGLHTDGLNNISLDRRERYGGVGFTKYNVVGYDKLPSGELKKIIRAVYEKTDRKLQDVLPTDVHKKLIDLHKSLKK